jgi:cell shape-determining protein MreC
MGKRSKIIVVAAVLLAVALIVYDRDNAETRGELFKRATTISEMIRETERIMQEMEHLKDRTQVFIDTASPNSSASQENERLKEKAIEKENALLLKQQEIINLYKREVFMYNKVVEQFNNIPRGVRSNK